MRKEKRKKQTEVVRPRWMGWEIRVVVVLLVGLLWYFIYPETLGNIEAESFFVWTPDYIGLKRSEGVAGLLSLASQFVSQFFRWREGGAFIQALLFGCVLGGMDLLWSRLRCWEASWFSWVVAGVFLCMQLRWGSLEPALTTLVVIGIIIVCLIFLRRWMRLNLPVRVLGITNPKVRTGLSVLIVLLAFVFFVVSPSAHKREKRIAVKQAATATAWNYVLYQITPDGASHDSILRRYALLALAGQDQLVENLSKFHLSSPNDFYYYLPSLPEERYFNALFYRMLGLYNEYVHQLFETGIQYSGGMTFGCLRQITDGYLKMGNVRLARKYLIVLSRSTCHGDWVKARLALLEALEENPIEIPEKSYMDIFIGSYPLLHEMELLLAENPDNAKAKMYYDAARSITPAPAFVP